MHTSMKWRVLSWCPERKQNNSHLVYDEMAGPQNCHTSYTATCRNTITQFSVWLLFYKGLLEESLAAINLLKLQVSRRKKT